MRAVRVAVMDNEVGPRASMSCELFGIDWAAELPLALGGGVTLHAATLDQTLAFIAAHYASLFGARADDHRFLAEPLTPAKRRFLALSDRFVFLDGARPVGVLLGQPSDWSTYYWRSVGLLPAYQGRGLLASALAHTDRVMRAAGVARVEGDAAPNNPRQLRLLMRLGYVVTGSLSSERWGNVLRLTKYLDADAAARFASQFCRDTFPSADNPEP